MNSLSLIHNYVFIYDFSNKRVQADNQCGVSRGKGITSNTKLCTTKFHRPNVWTIAYSVLYQFGLWAR